LLESALVALLLGSGSPLLAEEKSQSVAAKPGPPVFKAGIDLVNITLTVRDKEGQLVSDLSADDFVIFEDGHPQRVELFARATEEGKQDALALDLGLLLDTSESMAQQMKLTRESALRFLDAIPRARDLLVIFFDQDIRISRYDSENQQGLVDRIIDMKGSGNTALYDAITVYLSRVEESQGRKVLVLFTDGEDSRSQTSLNELISLVRSSNVMVYAISFAGSSFSLGSNRYVSARSFLTYLATMTGGDIFTPSSPHDLPGIYQKILNALAGQYVIGFISDNLKRDGKFRKLRIELKDKSRGFKIQHRIGYVPAASK
jgi:Ca-activated chloride channel family protein